MQKIDCFRTQGHPASSCIVLQKLADIQHAAYKLKQQGTWTALFPAVPSTPTSQKMVKMLHQLHFVYANSFSPLTQL